MRLIVLFVLTLSIGVLVAFGIAELIGLILPSTKTWVFTILSIYWLYLGWKYASLRDRINKEKGLLK